ncbi:hypothetical protein LGQ02_08615 [Bacillus shivajii]|uniref:hypothetical protein n=1 Tax=Bacillus shivajii TaxID=1983719 RepID=UPI001CF95F1D|nr:hypothetical protein [Bacillus shivajii]UCZ54791.1 hypothetical protein LGQ02_08615 [Bacillus shivajii]
MNLTQILLSQPHNELIERKKSLSISCNVHSKQQLTEEIVQKLLCPDYISKSWNERLDRERNLLTYMAFRPALSYQIEELFSFYQKEERKCLIDDLGNLKRTGWLFEDKYGWMLPQELENWIKHHYKNELQKTSLFIPSDDDHDISFIDDLFTFMDFVSDRNVRLTKKKTIYKRELMLLLSELTQNEQLPDEKWRFGYGRHFDTYPDKLSLLYDFCFEQGWITEGTTLSVTKAWEKGQSYSVNEMLERLNRCYINIYKRAIPNIKDLLNMLIFALEPKIAVEEETIKSVLLPLVRKYYFDSREDIITKRILKMLVYQQFLKETVIDGQVYYTLQRKGENHRKKHKKFNFM